MLDVVISHEHGKKKQKDFKELFKFPLLKMRLNSDPFCSLEFFKRFLSEKSIRLMALNGTFKKYLFIFM